MTLLKRLQAHKGGIIKLKTALYWYKNGRGWDRNPGRICLLLDAAVIDATPVPIVAATVTAATARTAARSRASTHLLIDGSPHWVWVAAEDVDLIGER